MIAALTDTFSRRPRCSHSAVATLTVLALQMAGCQTVTVHPKLETQGLGPDTYHSVSIQCGGADNQSLKPRLEQTCRDLGYAVVSEPGELLLDVRVHKSTREDSGAQMAVAYWCIWNIGVGDAAVKADARLIEASSGETLLEYKSERTALTNYEATRCWVDSLAATWRKYLRRAQDVPATPHS